VLSVVLSLGVVSATITTPARAATQVRAAYATMNAAYGGGE
jgi:hypothetical protein